MPPVDGDRPPFYMRLEKGKKEERKERITRGGRGEWRNGWRGDREERGEEVNSGDRVEEGWRREGKRGGGGGGGGRWKWEDRGKEVEERFLMKKVEDDSGETSDLSEKLYQTFQQLRVLFYLSP